MQIHEVFDGVATAFEVIGVLAMIVGFVVAFIAVSYTHLTLPTKRIV